MARSSRGILMVVGWLLALICLALIFNGVLQKQINPNTEDVLSGGQGDSVILRANSSGHYLGQGTINRHSVVFLLDTGATDIAIPLAVARQINLRLGETYPLATANGMVAGYRAELDLVTLGGIRMEKLDAHVLPNMAGDQVLLGMNFLRNLDWEQSNQTLKLRIPSD